MTDFQHVGLLGFGTMGAGIAQVIAASGRTVRVLETDEERFNSGREFVSDFLDGGIARQKVTEEEKTEILGRLIFAPTVQDLADSTLIIESITEDMDAKRELLTQVADVVGSEAVIVTNTSALSVTDLAAALPQPSRIAGLHFFNPAPTQKTIEVIKAFHTDQSVIDRLIALVESLGNKSPVVVKDRPGFLVNYLLIPYLNDVIQAYDDELASAEDLDLALKLGLGYKTGPLEMLDLIGIDVHLRATEAAYEATRDKRFAPPPLLRQMVAAGQLGNKNGAGFRTVKNSKE